MKSHYTEQDILELIAIQHNIVDTISLNAIIMNRDDRPDEIELGEIIKDPGPSPEDVAIQQSNEKILLRYINKLSPREQVVILYRFGFMGTSETLEQIGQRFGVSRERIRQVEKKALEKLRRYIKRAGMKAGDF